MIVLLFFLSDQLKAFYEDIKFKLTVSTSEIQKYCDENNWVNEIKAYLRDWSLKMVAEWKKVGAFEIEEQLVKIRNWIETVKTNIQKTIITTNKMLKIDTRPIENFLVPRLEQTYTDICEYVVKEFNKDMNSFITQLNKNIKVSCAHRIASSSYDKSFINFNSKDLNQETRSIEDFADYTKKVNKHKGNIKMYENQINSIKSLMEVHNFYLNYY